MEKELRTIREPYECRTRVTLNVRGEAFRSDGKLMSAPVHRSMRCEFESANRTYVNPLSCESP